MIPFTPASLRGARPVFLLDMTFAGHRWCIATAAVSLDSDDGPVQYSPGLDLRGIDESFDRLELDPAAQSATLAAVLSNGASVLDLSARGHRLDRCPATVAMIFVDANDRPIALADGSAQTWEDRAILIAGRVQQPQYGVIDKPSGWFGCTVRDSLWEDTGRIIPQSRRINTTTWPTAREGESGKVYPLVFGQPGREGNGVDGYKGSPAYAVEYVSGSANLLLIAGHAVAALEVTILDTLSGTVQGFAVTHQEDGIGNMCAVVDVTGASAPFDRTSDEFWVCWAETAEADGGMALADGALATAVTGVGSLLIYMLRASTIPVDAGRCAAARRQLDRVEVAGYINEPDATPWGFISDELLKLVPCSMRRGPHGVYPLPRFDIPTASAVPSLTEGPTFRRLSVQVEQVNPASSVEVPYLPGATTAPSARWAQPVASTPTDTAASRSLLLRAEGQAIRVESPYLWAREAADAVAVGVLLGRPIEAVTVAYSASSDYAWLSPGDWVAVTDDDPDRGMFWTDRIGQITGRSWAGTSWEFSIFFETRAPYPPRRSG